MVCRQFFVGQRASIPVTSYGRSAFRCSRLRCWQLRRRFRPWWFRWRERFHKSLSKIVNILEVLDRILLGLSKYPGADQVKNHVPDVLAGMNAPVVELVLQRIYVN